MRPNKFDIDRIHIKLASERGACSTLRDANANLFINLHVSATMVCEPCH